MKVLRLAVGIAVGCAGFSATVESADQPKIIKETMTIESHRLVLNEFRTPEHPGKHVSRLMPVEVAVYRPNDHLKHPAIVYLHGGGMSFADPVMKQFHAELASRGLVVLAPHYLLDGTGWYHWQESALNTVTLATELPSVDSNRIGMSGLSMGGQIGLSTAARDPRIKAVAEYFTAWPGSLPDEPIEKLPPVLLLNGTADPVIPFHLAMVLDSILEAHHLPFERHVYEGLGHGFRTSASFEDGLLRTAAFFGGQITQPNGGRAISTPTTTGIDPLTIDTASPIETFAEPDADSGAFTRVTKPDLSKSATIRQSKRVGRNTRSTQATLTYPKDASR